MGRYNLVVFDLDGTILDTTEGVLSAVKYTIQEMGYIMPEDNVLKTFIGPPIQDSFAKTFGLSGDILQKIAGIFRRRYKGSDLLKAKPYEGIYEVFRKLSAQSIISAVATYKREDYAIDLLKAYHFDMYTQIMHGADHENKLKKQDIIRKCISEACIDDYRSVVMIGDTIHDADGASELGIDFIGVTYGFGLKKDNLSQVVSIGFADTPIGLLNFI